MDSTVAVPSPAIAAKPPQHPPYREMILKAVGSLHERGGSSKRAISKFIKSTYANLSKKHDALLGLHLRRLLASGELDMLKHSYKLHSRSQLNLASSTLPSRPRGRPKKVPEGSISVKRGPGRPPRSQLPAVKKGRGRPPNILAVKKRPGRPLKALAVKKGPGRPPKTLAMKKGPGRAPKILAVGMAKVAMGGVRKRGRPPMTEKKGPGRPKKELGGSLEGGEKRKGPGRPRKEDSGAPPVKGGTVGYGKPKKSPGRPRKLDSGGEKKRPGRPKKVEGLLVTASKEGQLVSSEKKGRGRPKMVKEPVESISKEGSEQMSGKKRGRGRPKKE